MKKTLCCCWDKTFWNGFCSPRYPGVFIILILCLLSIIYACVLLLMSNYYENFSEVQHLGYLSLLGSNILTIIPGFLSIHFLSLRPMRMKISYCVFLHIGLILAIILGSISLNLLLIPPTNEEMQDYALRNLRVYHRIPFMLKQLFMELKCCGIDESGDVFDVSKRLITEHGESIENDTTTEVTFYRIPKACCKQDDQETFKECNEKWTANPVNETEFQNNKLKYLYNEPCLQGKDFSSIEWTETYSLYLKTALAAIGVFFFIFGILIVFNYYIWYRFPRVPMPFRPRHFNEDIRLCVTCHWGQVRRNLYDETRKLELLDEIILEQNRYRKIHSDFHERHELIKRSIMSLKEQEREKRIHKTLTSQRLQTKESKTPLNTVFETRFKHNSSNKYKFNV